MTAIEILKKKGPMMSGELAKILADQNSITPNTASQQIRRNEQIQRIRGFYSSGQAFCFLKLHENNDELYDRFVQSLYDHGRKYWFTINALRLHGGIITRNYLECYTNYPIKALKKHRPFSDVMHAFVKEKILIKDGQYYSLSPRFGFPTSSFYTYKAIETIKENLLSSSFKELVRNIGMISYESGEMFGEFGKFRWAFKGVSYVSGVMRDKQPGFLLADILIGSSKTEIDVEFFIQKLRTVQSFSRASRVIPFLIVDGVSPSAFDLLKKHGVIVGFLHELFGEKYAEALRELVAILLNVEASLKATPDKFFKLLENLKEYNIGLTNNMKGYLFELMVCQFHLASNCPSIIQGRIIYENNGKHEMDVLAIYNDRIVIAECKALKSKVDFLTINKWTNKKIPAFKAWVKKQEMLCDKPLEFEYWSTSGFEEYALKELSELSEKSKKFKVSYFDGKQMREKVREKNKNMKEALDEFFLKTKI